MTKFDNLSMVLSAETRAQAGAIHPDVDHELGGHIQVSWMARHRMPSPGTEGSVHPSIPFPLKAIFSRKRTL